MKNSKRRKHFVLAGLSLAKWNRQIPRLSGSLTAAIFIWASGLPTARAEGPALLTEIAVRSVTWEGIKGEKVRLVLDRALESQRPEAINREQVDKLAALLTERLRKAGFPIAQVMVSQEDWTLFEQTGELKFRVFEGEIGALRVGKNTSRIATSRLERTARDALCPQGVGDVCVMTTERFERASLLLQDLPGVRLYPVELSPEGVGRGQTAVVVSAEPSQPPYSGSVTVDNYGAQATGTKRLAASIMANNWLHMGDVWQGTVLATNREQYTGSLGFSAPLSYTGLRTQANLSHTTYTVSAVNARGTADSGSLGLAYPLARGLGRNWTIGLDGADILSKLEVAGQQASAPRHIGKLQFTLSGNSGDQSVQAGSDYWSAGCRLGEDA